MSNANASAKKRRAPISIEPPKMQIPAPVQSMNGAGLTLPQVIALIDKRLVNLEVFVTESKSNSSNITSQPVQSVPLLEQVNSSNMDEFNARFELLADEIANMKNIVLSLQSYTMDVNKMLLEERVIREESTDESNDDVGIEPVVDKSVAVSSSVNTDSIMQLKNLMQQNV